jgi:hypothetical protein
MTVGIVMLGEGLYLSIYLFARRRTPEEVVQDEQDYLRQKHEAPFVWRIALNGLQAARLRARHPWVDWIPIALIIAGTVLIIASL